MSWKGAPGALYIGDKPVYRAVSEISSRFGVSMSKVMIGTEKEPPDSKEYVMYAECNGVGAVIWLRKHLDPNCEWYNWSYTDQS